MARCYPSSMGRGQGQEAPHQDSASAKRAPSPLEVLVIEDDEYLGESTMAWMKEVCQVSARLATNLKEGQQCLDEKLPDVILCDNGLPDGKGVEFLPPVKAQHPQVVCILWSGALSREDREAAGSLDGCYDKGLRGLDDVRAQLSALSRD